MKSVFSIVRISLLVIAMVAVGPAYGQSTYKLNAGDVLRIDVWNEESLTREIVVLPDGFLSFPLVGVIRVGGKTTEEVEAALVDGLGKYLKDSPTVTVSINQLAGNKVYVLGKVNRPGEFPVNTSIDVMQALAMAGGMNTFASENSVIILRRDSEGVQQAIPFEYGDVKAGEALQTNILLESGDVVVVP